MVCNNRFRWRPFTEQEQQVLHEASEIMERLRKEGKVHPHPTDNHLISVEASDEEHEALSKAVQILRGWSRDKFGDCQERSGEATAEGKAETWWRNHGLHVGPWRRRSSIQGRPNQNQSFTEKRVELNLTSLLSIQREVERIRQTVKPDKPKDIWISWHITAVTKENVEEIKRHGFKEDPNDMMETIRVTTRVHPNPVNSGVNAKT